MAGNEAWPSLLSQASTVRLSTYVLSLARREDRRANTCKLLEDLDIEAAEFIDALDGRALHARGGAVSAGVGGCEFNMEWPAASTDPAWAQPLSGLDSSRNLFSADVARARIRLRASRPSVERWCVLACNLGHDEILRRIETQDMPFALVLEDDCVLNGSAEVFHERYRRGLQALQDKWGDDLIFRVLYLGGNLGFTPRGDRTTYARAIARDLLVDGRNTYTTHAYVVSKWAAPLLREMLHRGYAADAAFIQASQTEPSGWFRFHPKLVQQNRRRYGSDIGRLPQKTRRRSAAEGGEEAEEVMAPTS